MAKISIIANFYKSERYISKLIESVIAQTYEDWELLCVNDCSPGRDKEIILKYAAKDKRIRLIDNEVNLGICKAKYRGIQEAKGEYLCFIDGDDWLESDALKRMMKPALEYDLDMVVMNHKKVLPVLGYSQLHKSKADFEVVIDLDCCAADDEDARKNFVRYYGNFFGNYCYAPAYWGKLIKKAVIEESRFTPPESYIAEDFVFSMTIFPFLKRIMFVDYAGYNWRWGGLTSGKKNDIWTGEKNIRRSNEIYEERLNLIETYGLQCYEYSLMVEQRNNFVGFVGGEAKKDINTEYGENVIKVLQEILSADFYCDFVKLKFVPQYSNDKLLSYIIERDARSIYDFCRKTYLSNSKTRIVNSFIHKLLYPLAKV